MPHDTPAYGLWSLVIINTIFFVFFATSFSVGGWKKNWRELGMFSAFVLALFTEMYGFPLTICFLSGWLAARYPGLDLMSHESGHLWSTLLGLNGDPHLSFLRILSTLLIGAGLVLLGYSWQPLYEAQKAGKVATTGPYASIRHPQNVAFVAVMFGFLLQWPTIPTLLMFPVMAYVLRSGKNRPRSSSSATPIAPIWRGRPPFFQECPALRQQTSGIEERFCPANQGQLSAGGRAD